MLFPPQSKKRIREPAAMREELMNEGVTGGTDRHQPFFLVDPGFPVMNGSLIPCPTALAAKPIAPEDLVPEAGKRAGGMPASGVASRA